MFGAGREKRINVSKSGGRRKVVDGKKGRKNIKGRGDEEGISSRTAFNGDNCYPGGTNDFKVSVTKM